MIQEMFSTAVIAALPLGEQRLAIPLGFIRWNLSIWQAVLAATIGNIIAVGLVLWFLPIITKFIAKHSPFCDKILQKIFTRTRAKHTHKFDAWGNIFLIIFVMIPLPGSGGWSGALVAWLFGIKYWRAMTFISLGLIFGAIIVAGMTLGADESITFFTEVFAQD
jgi:uncharacterized membrane protein